MNRFEVDSRRIGLITGTYTDDWSTGETVYDVRASRVHGLLAVTLPESEPWRDHPELPDPWTTVVRVEPGRPEPGRILQRADHIEVNGIPLCGVSRIDTTALAAGPLTEWQAFARRIRHGRYDSGEAPAPTRARFAAVVEALVLHWTTRPDRAALRIAAAQHQATGYARHLHDRARTARERAEQLLTEAARYDTQAAAAGPLLALPPATPPPALTLLA